MAPAPERLRTTRITSAVSPTGPTGPVAPRGDVHREWPHNAGVTSPLPAGSAAGVVRLLTTAGGRVLCLAGAVDAEAVDRFLRRYGREPAPIEAIDAGSVTFLSPAGLDLLVDHLDAAAAAGRAVVVRPSPPVARLLAVAGRRSRT